jgi:septal ring factor EnvC (AmiA/AmiB activator)
MSPRPNLDLPVAPSPKLTELQENFAKIERDAEAARQQLEAAVEKAKANQRRLDALNRAVDDCADNLRRADEQHAAFKNAIGVMLTGVVDAWSRHHVNGSAGAMPSYADIIDYERAVADFPRVRAVLEKRLNEAQGNLTKFQKENDL